MNKNLFLQKLIAAGYTQKSLPKKSEWLKTHCAIKSTIKRNLAQMK